MATKTVINTNMPAARGISIVIDQDQAQQQRQPIAVNCGKQQLDVGKITISQPTNNDKNTTTATTSTVLTRTESDARQQQNGAQVSPKSPATSTTFISHKRNYELSNDDLHKNGEFQSVHNGGVVDNDDVEEQRRIGSTETGYTTATFPQTLLKVATTSERGKLNGHSHNHSNGNKQVKEDEKKHNDHDGEKSQLNGNVTAGVSVTHERGESNGASVGDDAVVLAATTSVLSKRTMIIQCNEDDDYAAHDDESVNGRNHEDDHNDHEQAKHNDESACNGNDDNNQVAVGVGVGVSVGVGVDDDDDVVKNGQNAFAQRIGRSSGSGSGSGSGNGSGSASVVDAHGRQLESVRAVITSNSLTTKADCASALTETVRYADNDSHVVKIQIKPSSEAIDIEKQVTVVTLNDKDRLPIETVIEKSNTTIETVQSAGNTELRLNLDKMVQKRLSSPSPSRVSTVSTVTTVVPHGPNSGRSADTSTPPASLPVSVSSNINSGATTVTELNVSHPSYMYYVMSSGQFSPCDTLDSGTGSDLESNNAGTPSPKVLTNASSNPNGGVGVGVGVGGAPKLELHLKTTKIRVNNGKHTKSTADNGEHARAGSLTDSEESESSSLSCDSLHSTEFMRQSSVSPTTQKAPNARAKVLGSFLPDSLLRDIRDRKFPTNDFESKYGGGNGNGVGDGDGDNGGDAHSPPTVAETVNEQDYAAVKHAIFLQERNSNNTNNKRASLPGKTFVLNTEDGTFVDTKMNSMPRRYEADKYYNFHVNEHENFRSFGNGNGSVGNADDLDSVSEYDSKSIHEDAFAGYKDLRCGSATSTIRSSKGTVRGVKNRVRNGIATFLQLQQPNVKNYKEKDLGKVVLYTTSMGIIRDTYAKCSNVKQILRTLLVKFEERDVFMSIEYQQEIKERMHSEVIRVPQLFVEGQHIGDADTVERLNESGELRQLLKPYKSISSTYTCQTCGGYRLLPCPSCNGSKKSVHRNHFTAEFVALKCMNCDEVGLVKCHNC